MLDRPPEDRVQLTYRLAAPVTSLALGLAAAVALVLLPERTTSRVKLAAASLLRPGQTAALKMRERCGLALAWGRDHVDTASQLHEARTQCRKLEQENLRLSAELEAIRTRSPMNGQDDGTERLLSAQSVSARVLGRQALTFLAQRHLLDAGSQQGVQPDALVVDDRRPRLDRGRDADLRAELPVLSQGRLWGKVAEVGASTSVVRSVTETGFRDDVRLATPGEDGILHWGPSGVLEGTGESAARLRGVPASEAVQIGDLVYTTSAQGALPQPLLCGRVVRLARPTGASQWDIWVEPAVRPGEPDRVAVVRIELNPRRKAIPENRSGP